MQRKNCAQRNAAQIQRSGEFLAIFIKGVIQPGVCCRLPPQKSGQVRQAYRPLRRNGCQGLILAGRRLAQAMNENGFHWVIPPLNQCK